MSARLISLLHIMTRKELAGILACKQQPKILGTPVFLVHKTFGYIEEEESMGTRAEYEATMQYLHPETQCTHEVTCKGTMLKLQRHSEWTLKEAQLHHDGKQFVMTMPADPVSL